MRKIIKYIFLLAVICQFSFSQVTDTTVHFKFKYKTGTSATIAILLEIRPNVMGTLLTDGDEIGVLTASGLCCGGVVWNSIKSTAITAWGDDAQTPVKDGFTLGEMIYFRIWVKKANMEYLARAKYKNGLGLKSDYFDNNGQMVLDSLIGYRKSAVEDYNRLPKSVSVSQNYPNPFNPVTMINFNLSETRRVKVQIIDIHGNLVKTLLDEKQYPGPHSLKWDGKDYRNSAVSSGIYFYKVIVDGIYSETKKMIFTK